MNLKSRKVFPCVALLAVSFLCGSAPAQMNGEAAPDWPAGFRDMLQHGVLQFWIDHARRSAIWRDSRPPRSSRPADRLRQ